MFSFYASILRIFFENFAISESLPIYSIFLFFNTMTTVVLGFQDESSWT